MPYSILHQSDARFAPIGEYSGYAPKFGREEAGPPVLIPLKGESGGRRVAKPAGVYDLNNHFPEPDFEPNAAPTVLASAEVFKALEELAPGTFDSFTVMLAPKEGAPFEFKAIVPRKTLKSHAEAKPGDLSWGGFSFTPAQAPGKLFKLETDRGCFLVVEQEIAAALEKRNFFDTVLSDFR